MEILVSGAIFLHAMLPTSNIWEALLDGHIFMLSSHHLPLDSGSQANGGRLLLKIMGRYIICADRLPSTHDRELMEEGNFLKAWGGPFASTGGSYYRRSGHCSLHSRACLLEVLSVNSYPGKCRWLLNTGCETQRRKSQHRNLSPLPSISAEPIPHGDTTNKENLWEALVDGHIDMPSSYHSPTTPDLKATEQGNFLKAWRGISSLQGSAGAWRGHDGACGDTVLSMAPNVKHV